MEFDYTNTSRDFFNLLNSAKKHSEDLILHTDKRTKGYQKLEELTLIITSFLNFIHKDKVNILKENKHIIEMDIDSFNNLNIIRGYLNKISINEVLNEITYEYKNKIENDMLIKVNTLIDIEIQNIKIIDSFFIEKYINTNELKILYSKSDIVVINREEYINLLNFHLIEKEFSIPIYIPEYLTFKEFNKFYK